MEQKYIHLYARLAIATCTLDRANESELITCIGDFEAKMRDFEEGVPLEVREEFFFKDVERCKRVYQEKLNFLKKEINQ